MRCETVAVDLAKPLGQKRWCVLSFKIAQTDSWVALTWGPPDSQLHSLTTQRACVYLQYNTLNHPNPFEGHNSVFRRDKPQLKVILKLPFSGCLWRLYCPYFKVIRGFFVSQRRLSKDKAASFCQAGTMKRNYSSGEQEARYLWTGPPSLLASAVSQSLGFTATSTKRIQI